LEVDVKTFFHATCYGTCSCIENTVVRWCKVWNRYKLTLLFWIS